MKISITIPTFRQRNEINKMLSDINNTVKNIEFELYASCIKQSAAKNRNDCIDKTSGDIIVMMDDDITGFKNGWIETLIKPLIEHYEKYSIVSSRLKNQDGNFQGLLGDNNVRHPVGHYQTCIHTTQSGLQMVASACIAFSRADSNRIKDGINKPFDENYQAACWEDSDFCMQMRKVLPNKNIIFVNDCQLIHKNAMAGRTGEQVRANNVYFNRKWKTNI
jgi:glycosyltransferase involved in cell wall biosynthesis